MSVQAMSWVFDHSDSALGARLVALSVANHADKTGRNAWAAVATYAEEAHLSERQTQYALRALCKAGELRKAGLHGARADRRTAIYEFPAMVDGAQILHPVEDVDGVQSPPSRGAESGADGVHSTAPKPSLEPSLEPSTPFDQFWNIYPRKVGKGAARRAFKTAVNKVEAETILAATAVFARQVRGVERQFVAHPATWLNGERWDDEEQPNPSSTSPVDGLVWAQCGRCNQDRRIGELVGGICTTCRLGDEGAVSA